MTEQTYMSDEARADAPIRLDRPIIGLLLAAILITGVLFGLAVWRETARIQESAVAGAEASARLLQEHAAKVLSIHALALRSIEWAVDDKGWEGATATPDIHNRLSELVAAAPEVNAYVITDGNGIIRLASYAWPLEPRDLSDRDYFQAHHSPDSGLYIGTRLKGRYVPDVFFTISRRMSAADGTLQGVAQVALRPGYFEGFYQSVVGDSQAAVLLLRHDGTLLARYPSLGGGQVDIGRVPDLVAKSPNEPDVRLTSPLDGVERLYVRRPVGDLPLTIAYGVPVAPLKAAQKRVVVDHALYAGGALLLLGGFGALALRRSWRLDRAESDLRRINAGLERHVAERTWYLDVALEESRRLQAELREWAGRYEAAVEASRQILYDWDPYTDRMVWGGAVERITGYTLQELHADIGHWLELIHPDDRDAFRAEAQRVRATGLPFHLEYRLIRKDGGIVDCVDSGQFFRDNDGRVARMIGFVTDISARKNAERALRASEERFRALFDTSTQGVIIHDVQGGIVDANPAAERILGLARSELVARGGLGEDWHVADEDGCPLAAAQHPAMVALREGRLVRDRIIGLLGPGWAERRWLRIDAIPQFRCDGQSLTGVYVLFGDITGARKAEQARQLLVHEVDHRAKNALAVVQAVVRLSRAEDPDRFMEGIEGRIDALARTHSLLAARRWEGADFRTVLEEELAAYRPEDMDRVCLRGPPVILTPTAIQAFGMVVHELATNAAKHGAFACRSGRLDVSWRVDMAAGMLRIGWRESGAPITMPPSRRGFGSTLVETSIVSQLDGHVEIMWQPDGADIRIEVPLIHTTSGLVAVEKGQSAMATGCCAPPPAIAQARVLLVEDNALIALELSCALRKQGCVVVGPALTLESAIRLAAETPIDAAILDIDLHGAGVFPLAETLRQQGVAFLFCTGYACPDVDERFGNVPIVQKPIRPEEISAALARILPHPDRLAEPLSAGSNPI